MKMEGIIKKLQEEPLDEVKERFGCSLEDIEAEGEIRIDNYLKQVTFKKLFDTIKKRADIKAGEIDKYL